MQLRATNSASGLKMHAQIDSRQSLFEAVRNYVVYFWPNTVGKTHSRVHNVTRDIVCDIAQFDKAQHRLIANVTFEWEY